jgi:hypothetical protein
VIDPPDGPIRRAIRRVALALGGLGLAWAVVLWVFGGFDATIVGARLTTNEPLRPLFIASLFFTIFILAGGEWRVPIRVPDRWLKSSERRDTRLAGGLAAATFIIGVVYCTGTAGGADSYGYVSQADLWLTGDLVTRQPWVEEAPWVSRRWDFSPLGYRPVDHGDPWAIVPLYAPGLSLVMAAFKYTAGHCAMFIVVPLAGAVLVWMTYLIGRGLATSGVGLVGAWLVATSPAFLFMLMWPMTDVPVAAAWAVAFYFLFGRTAGTAAMAGIASALAVLIRPNLVFLAVVLGLPYALRMWRGDHVARRQAAVHGAIFAAASASAGIFIALLHTYLYGSPFASGYAGLEGMFGRENVLPNFRNYLGWLVETQTPIALVGLAALVLPTRRLWPGASDRSIFAVVGLFLVGLWAMYCAYLVFNDWWYLRFLLSMWPFMMVGIGAVAMAIARSVPRAAALAVIGAVIGFGAYEFRVAILRGAFSIWQDEVRYVSVARLVRTATEPNSVIVCIQHSGSVRYYGERITLRFDGMDQGLDRAVDWLASRGIHAYLLVEDWEVPKLEQRFPGERVLEVLKTPPILVYSGTVKLFDLLELREPTAPTDAFVESFQNVRCAAPAPAPTLVLR